MAVTPSSRAHGDPFANEPAARAASQLAAPEKARTTSKPSARPSAGEARVKRPPAWRMIMSAMVRPRPEPAAHASPRLKRRVSALKADAGRTSQALTTRTV